MNASATAYFEYQVGDMLYVTDVDIKAELSTESVGYGESWGKQTFLNDFSYELDNPCSIDVNGKEMQLTEKEFAAAIGQEGMKKLVSKVEEKAIEADYD